MDKEQRQRMANRTIIQEGEPEDIEYTVQVSGDCVELHQTYPQPWENEHGTGPDISHEVWTMNLDTFKRFIEAAQWCVEKSEAFEASHPKNDEVHPSVSIAGNAAGSVIITGNNSNVFRSHGTEKN